MARKRPIEQPPEERDLAFMKDPDKWPNLLLPLKRRSKEGFMETGYLTDRSPNVHLGNIWMAKPDDKVVQYPNLEAVVTDGWRVD